MPSDGSPKAVIEQLQSRIVSFQPRMSTSHTHPCGRTWGRAFTLIGSTSIAWILVGCEDTLSIIAPAGPASRQIANIWWILLGLATAVFVAVLAFLLVAITRRFQEDRDEETRERYGERIIVVAGIVVPGVILLFVLGMTLNTLRVLAEPEIPPEQTIQVIGHQWWWEVRYPAANVVTANEIHLPVGRPLRIELYSADVIHSFWVPELHGKLDLIPGQTTEMWLAADVPGIYRGECAEFCGIQHAKMAFVVVAQPEEEYRLWLEQHAQPAQVPSERLAVAGAGIFMLKGCGNCHNVEGTAADGEIGPDLTHIASRLTLAAGTVPNTRGHLAGWITDPQHTKPGAYMPPTILNGEDLEALLAYLSSLE